MVAVATDPFRRAAHAVLLDRALAGARLAFGLDGARFWLAPALRVMLPLETSYEETCQILGIA